MGDIISNKRYALIFNVPSGKRSRSGELYTEICRIESDEPFMAIHKGDLIDPRVWEGESFRKYMELFEYGDLLKVDVISHFIVDRDEDNPLGNHVIDIFTKAVKR